MIYLEFELGEKYKALGMQRSANHADRVTEKWSDKALEAFIDWLKTVNGSFTCEDFRAEMVLKLVEPPNLRAYGAIMFKAARMGLIKRIGAEKVSNPKAHRCFASLWIKNEP